MIRRLARALRLALPLIALLASGVFSPALTQSTSTKENPPAPLARATKQDSSQDKSATAGGSTADDSTTQKPAKPRKVITNDDIDAAHARPAHGPASGRKTGDSIPATGMCDEGCAFEARQQLGYGPEREGEWQIQLVGARRNLSTDARWRQAYFELNQAAQLYCTFVNQQRAAVLPSGNDYQAAYERGERQQYAEVMGRTLSQKLSNASAETNRLIEETRQLEPVRAAMMRVLVSHPYKFCQSIDP